MAYFLVNKPKYYWDEVVDWGLQNLKLEVSKLCFANWAGGLWYFIYGCNGMQWFTRVRFKLKSKLYKL